LTFKKPEPVAGKIKSANSPRERRKRKGDKSKRAAGDGNGEGNDEEQAQGSESDVLWAVGDASDDEDEEDEDVDHHQHPLHQDLPKATIASTGSGSPSQRRSSRRAVNERTGLVTSEDEGDGAEYMDGSRLMDTNRKRSMDPFRDDDERHEMHNVTREVNGRPLR
jgi:hypothetical protein